MKTTGDDDRIKGRRVWLTGASSGIGRAVTLELTKQGAIVAISSRRAETLQALTADAPDRIFAFPLDVTDRAANQKVAAEIAEQLGGIDIAFFNAGTCEYVDVRHFDSALFERTYRTNVLSMAYGIEAALPFLRKSARPLLVGMSSTASYGGLPRASAYGGSKAAIKNMFESLRLDLSAEKIPVSIVCPGFVRTPLTDQNDFPMPMRIEADDAARRIVRGLARGTQEIHFPRRFSLMLKLFTSLPSPIYTAIASRLLTRQRRGASAGEPPVGGASP